MVLTCSIKNCKNNVKTAGVTLHRPPSDPNYAIKWLQFIDKYVDKTRKQIFICTSHFQEGHVDRTGSIVRIKPGCYPSIIQNISTTPKKGRPINRPKRILLKEFDSDFHLELPEKIRRVNHDHCYQASEEHLHKQVKILSKKLKFAYRKITILRKKLYLSKNRINTSQALLKDLRMKTNISTNSENILQHSFSDLLDNLLRRTKKNSSTKYQTSSKYDPEIRRFALTLNFLSPKSYEYVRNIFFKALPHPSTLREWYRTVNGQPGLNSEGLQALKYVANQDKRHLVSLVFDEMSIRKHIDFDGTKNVGFIDYGTNINCDLLSLATNALVYMVVSINGNWKIPIAYFLIDKVTAPEKTNITKLVIHHVTLTGITITNMTCDGLATNIKMAENLGVILDTNNIQTKLNFPDQTIYYTPDNCHMLKLVRNSLFHQEVFLDLKGREINVKYIKMLHALQINEKLHLANKLTQNHIHWEKQPMKVYLAAQTLSSSVADALDYCRSVLKLPEFEGSLPTIEFIRIFDRLFDIFNSRSPFGKHYKTPIRIVNEHKWRPFLDECFIYIQNLKLPSGQYVIHSRKKTAFIGYMILIRSLIGLYNTYINTETPLLKYLLSYKMSQDHLELFFSSIRSKGGHNNNPTAKQFIAAYKRLLIHHELVHSYSNVKSDDTSILNIGSCKKSTELQLQSYNFIEKYNLFDDFSLSEDDIPPDTSNMSIYADNIIAYIGGFVIRKLSKKIRCNVCLSSLSVHYHNSLNFKFIKLKSRGSLIYPSDSVIKICTSAEKMCRKILLFKNTPPSDVHIQQHLINVVFSDTYSDTFAELKEHVMDQDFVSNHAVQLIKNVANLYIKIRLHYINKTFNLQIRGQPIRQKLNKIILFCNQ